jgi:hypothetical protein
MSPETAPSVCRHVRLVHHVEHPVQSCLRRHESQADLVVDDDRIMGLRAEDRSAFLGPAHERDVDVALHRLFMRGEEPQDIVGGRKSAKAEEPGGGAREPLDAALAVGVDPRTLPFTMFTVHDGSPGPSVARTVLIVLTIGGLTASLQDRYSRAIDRTGASLATLARGGRDMKSFLKWTALIVGVGGAGAIVFRVVQAGRRQLKDALRRAEAVTDKTRAALEETETALHATRSAL